MKTGDVVRIVKQPHHLVHTYVEGYVCLVCEVADGQAELQALNPNGTSAGGGWVPLDCLAPESAPEWLEAKRIYEERIGRLQDGLEARRAAFNAKAARIAEAYWLKPEDVIAIFKEMSRAE